MRRSNVWLAGVAAGLLGLSLTLADVAWRADGARTQRSASRALVARLQLTDLALFTEARYTRHLSQADRFAPFQDHPMALEHFPSGSLVGPPAH